MSTGMRMKTVSPTTEPMIDQGQLNGWNLSWNPDDERFYVEAPGLTKVASFKRWTNATRYARTHEAPAVA